MHKSLEAVEFFENAIPLEERFETGSAVLKHSEIDGFGELIADFFAGLSGEAGTSHDSLNTVDSKVLFRRGEKLPGCGPSLPRLILVFPPGGTRPLAIASARTTKF